jgi:hypothetical protein
MRLSRLAEQHSSLQGQPSRVLKLVILHEGGMEKEEEESAAGEWRSYEDASGACGGVGLTEEQVQWGSRESLRRTYFGSSW